MYNQIMKNFWRNVRFFKASLAIAIIGVLAAGWFGGPSAALIVAILAVLEISLSFENAVVNATVLRRMSVFWQRMFLTVGILIAVFGMRLVFPLVIVSVTAGLSLGEVVRLALYDTHAYGEYLHAAHPLIASFGGTFLLMVFLNFIIDSGKRVHWISVIEQPLAKAGQLRVLPIVIAVSAILGTASIVGHDYSAIVRGGMTGLGVYLAVHLLSVVFERLGGVDPDSHKNTHTKPVTGLAALGLFAYLEVLDASFSFDGVVGAFAITSNVFAIMLGLGIGALVVRELTVWLVRHDTLTELIYLEHGAYYAVGALAVMLGISLAVEVPEAITGLIGAVIIAASLVSSFKAKA